MAMKIMRLYPGPTTREGLYQAIKAFHAIYGVEASEMRLTRQQVAEIRLWVPHEIGGLSYPQIDPFDPPGDDPGPHCTFMGIDTYCNATTFALGADADGPDSRPESLEEVDPLTRRSHEPDFGVRERAIDL